MWKVEYTEMVRNSKGLMVKGERKFHHEEFHTRKAARLWCKRANKIEMVLHSPNGECERFEHR